MISRILKHSNFKPLIFIIWIGIVLANSDTTIMYAYSGLAQWAVKMVPTLFPFMMISSIMIYSGADFELGKIVSPLLRHFFAYSVYGLYAVIMGFLCGFPMGAKVVSELLENNKISKSEAESLLGFCNNIGPSYFLGIITPILHQCGYNSILPFIFGMYGIPAIYGIILSHIDRRKRTALNIKSDTIALPGNKPDMMAESKAASEANNSHIKMNISSIIRKSCLDNTQSLILLGGYITFANSLRILIDFLPDTGFHEIVLSCFLEIIGGVQAIFMYDTSDCYKVFWIMVTLCFGGISCILQTSCFLEKCNLSIIKYLKHKLILTIISAIYYYSIIF